MDICKRISNNTSSNSITTIVLIVGVLYTIIKLIARDNIVLRVHSLTRL